MAAAFSLDGKDDTQPVRRTDEHHHAPQGDLFPDATPQPGRIIDFPAEARRRLQKMLAEAKAAKRLPWSLKETRTLEILFPQMAGWLPDDERDQLCFEFAQEIERLKNAA